MDSELTAKKALVAAIIANILSSLTSIILTKKYINAPYQEKTVLIWWLAGWHVSLQQAQSY